MHRPDAIPDANKYHTCHFQVVKLLKIDGQLLFNEAKFSQATLPWQ